MRGLHNIPDISLNDNSWIVFVGCIILELHWFYELPFEEGRQGFLVWLLRFGGETGVREP